jgi:MFS family permease
MATVDDRKDRLFSEANFSHTVSVFERPSYLYVFPAIFLYFLIMFGTFPIAFQVHIDQVCTDLNEDDCGSSKVSAQASTLNLLAALASSLTSILTCGIYGSMADVYGRKIVMITPFVGLMVYTAAYLYVDCANPENYVAIIVAANAFMGLSGSYIVFIMGSLCYTSDATTQNPHTRRNVYSYAEATIMTPEVFGPVLTGIWASYYGFFLPLLLGVILSAVAIIYIALLPESLPPDAHSRTQPLQLSPLQTFSNVMFLFTYRVDNDGAGKGAQRTISATHNPVSSVQRRSKRDSDSDDDVVEQSIGNEISPLPHIGFAFLLFFMAAMGQSAVRIVYVTHRFGWDAGLIGIYDGMEGFVISMSMVFAPWVIQRVLCFKKSLHLITWMQIGLVFRYVCDASALISLCGVLSSCDVISPQGGALDPVWVSEGHRRDLRSPALAVLRGPDGALHAHGHVQHGVAIGAGQNLLCVLGA